MWTFWFFSDLNLFRKNKSDFQKKKPKELCHPRDGNNKPQEQCNAKKTNTNIHRHGLFHINCHIPDLVQDILKKKTWIEPGLMTSTLRSLNI